MRYHTVLTAMRGLPATRLSLFLVPFCLRWPVDAAHLNGHVSLLIRHDEADMSRQLQIGLRDCSLIEKCSMCTFSDQKAIDACQETGRKEKRVCTALDGDGRSSVLMFMIDHHSSTNLISIRTSTINQIDSKVITDYYSCRYTDADNQFAMVRMLEVPQYFSTCSKDEIYHSFLYPCRFECK